MPRSRSASAAATSLSRYGSACSGVSRGRNVSDTTSSAASAPSLRAA
ncbi:hypothetical protein [Nonomuraea sp. NPDC003201]